MAKKINKIKLIIIIRQTIELYLHDLSCTILVWIITSCQENSARNHNKCIKQMYRNKMKGNHFIETSGKQICIKQRLFAV